MIKLTKSKFIKHFAVPCDDFGNPIRCFAVIYKGNFSKFPKISNYCKYETLEHWVELEDGQRLPIEYAN